MNVEGTPRKKVTVPGISSRKHEGDPIALTVNFAGPVADGGFEVVAEAARTNRLTQHWQLRMVQGAETVATGSAVLATRRATWSSLEVTFPAVAGAASLERAPDSRCTWTERSDQLVVPARDAGGGIWWRDMDAGQPD